ncbi:hypothetical protein D3C72_1514080 [compost metagenome]
MALEGIGFPPDGSQPFLYHRFIQSRLHLGQCAELILLDLVWQVADDGLVGFQASQQEGRRHPLEAQRDMLIALDLNRRRILPHELTEASQIAPVGEIQDAPVLGQAVLHRRASHGNHAGGRDRLHGLGLGGRRVLDILSLIHHHDAPRQGAQGSRGRSGDAVGRQQDVGPDSGELTLAAMEDANAQAGRETANFFLPIGQQTGRHDDQGLGVVKRAIFLELLQGRNDLQCLAQPHVICDHAAQTDSRVAIKPGRAALLVGA